MFSISGVDNGNYAMGNARCMNVSVWISDDRFKLVSTVVLEIPRRKIQPIRRALAWKIDTA